MAVNLSPVGGVAAQFFDNSGNVLTGGKLYTYLAGTTTPAVAYTTAAGNIAWSNPIILDAAGRVSGSGEIWLTDGIQYKFILRDSNDVLIATYDNINGINSNFVAFTNQQEIQTATAGQTVFNLTTMQYQPGTNSLTVFVDGVNQYGPGAQYAYVETDQDTVTFTNGLHVGAEVKFTTSQLNSGAGQTAAQTSFTGFKGQIGSVQDLADDDGSDWIGFDPDGVAAVARSAQDKMRDAVSVKDFGAVGDGVADDTLAIQNAINTVRIGTLYFPAGTYKVTDTIEIGTDGTATTINLIGDNPEAPMAGFVWSTIIDASSLGAQPLFEVGGLALNSDSNAIVGMKLLGPGQNGSIGIKLTTYATAADYRGSGDPGPLPEGSAAVIRVAHCMITQFSYGILGLSFLSNIEYNELRGLNEAIVVWPYTNDLHIENNHFYNIDNAGIDSGRFGNTAGNVQTGNMIINGNMFEAQGATCIDIKLDNAIWTTVSNNVHGLGSAHCLYVANPGYAYDVNWLSVISNKYQGGSNGSFLLDLDPSYALPDYDQVVIQGNSGGSLVLKTAAKIAGDIFNQFQNISTTDMSVGCISASRGQFPARTNNVNLISNGNFATNAGAGYSQSNATYPFTGGTVPTGWTVATSGAGVKLFWDVDGPLGTSDKGYRASGSQYAFDVRFDSSGSAGTVYFYQDVTVEANTVYTAVAFGSPTNVAWELQICDTSNNVLSTAKIINGTPSDLLLTAVSCNSNALTTLRVRFATSDANTGYFRYVAMYEGYWPVGSIGYA